MIDFFEYYKNRGQNVYNNNDSSMFENDTERLKGNDKIDINEINPDVK